MGWTVLEEHVYKDDGISGGEFLNRPGFTNMLSHLKEFDVLIMRDLDRLGRDMIRTPYHLQEILDAGIRVFYYATKQEEKADSPEAQLVASIRAYGAEVHRKKTKELVRAALERRAQQGYCTGSRCYGYGKMAVYQKASQGNMILNTDGSPKRSHVEWVVNEEQSEIVRGIFKMYLDGYGDVKIAKCLNGDPKYRAERLRYFNGRTPHSPNGMVAGWGDGQIRYILTNPRYTGKVKFGEYRNYDRGGTTKRERRKEFFIKDAPP